MTTKLSCFLFLGLFFVLLPVRPAYAATWFDASTACSAHLSAGQTSLDPANVYYPTSCQNFPDSNVFQVATVGKGIQPCGIYGTADLGSCAYTGADPPNCRVGSTEATWDTIDSWPDGTKCDDGCQVGLMVGGTFSGSYFDTGKYCPYDASSNPPDPPPVEPPPPDQPPQCNADGSCVTCSGEVCVTTGAQPAPTPPPPSTESPDGNHSTNTTTNTTNNYSTSTTSTTVTTGDGSGGTTGGTGNSTSTTTTTGSGTGSGSSDSQCTSAVCDVGEADGQVGGLYAHSNATPASVYGSFVQQVKSAPVVAAASGFFSVQASGSCPSWHIPGNQYWGMAGFDFSFFCQSGMLAIFQLAGWLVLAGAAFCAFRIALY